MKKTILSLALIGIFGAYTLYVRTTGADTLIALISSNNGTNNVPPSNNTTTTVSSSTTPIIIPKTTTTTPTKTTTPPKTTTPTPTPAPTPVPVNNGKYRNGTYTGDVADAYYGNVQVQVTISGGKISNVQFLDYPHDRSNSVRINSRAMPALISEAISAQDSNVNGVSGASFTSQAFVESLSSALNQARV